LTKKRSTKAKSIKDSTTGHRRQKEKVSDATKAFALASAKVAAGRHCSDITVLDLRGKSPATDYFVIATGTSDRQMRTVADEICEAAREQGLQRTVADEICEAAREQGLQRFGRAGYEQARWILLDFVDVVIHIFDSEYRNYYDLELLWGDADRLIIDK
jgi:ribosome-associated protein